MKFKDEVLVNNGFYSNIKGIVIDKKLISTPLCEYSGIYEYLVQFNVTDFYHKSWINEVYITRIKE